jgi:hypothetical protein
MQMNMSYKLNIWNLVGWAFGVLIFAMGIVNTFWGNDPGLGIGLLLLSFVYFPPVTALLRQKIGISVPVVAKIVLGLALLWVTLGVGELFNKIDLMIADF